MRWIKDHALGFVFVGLFLAAWAGQLVVQWYEFRSDQLEHDVVPSFWSSDFWLTFGQATLENWQSEFLQVASFVIAAAYFVYKGSSESPDGEERIEAKLNALLQERGIDPLEIEATLPEKYRSKIGPS